MSHMSSRFRDFSHLVKFFLLPSAVSVVLWLAFTANSQIKPRDNDIYLPLNFEAKAPIHFKMFTIGYSTAVASAVWVSTVMEYANHVITGSGTGAIRSGLWAVAQMDTLWVFPCEFAGLALEGPRHTPDSLGLRIMELGVRRNPKSGRLAILYSQLLLSAPWMDSAARLDSAVRILLPLANKDVVAPEYGRTLAFTLIAKGGHPASAAEQMIRLWSETDNPMLKLLFARKLPTLLKTADIDSVDGDAVTKGVEAAIESKDPGAVQAIVEVVRMLWGDASERDRSLFVLRKLSLEFEKQRKVTSGK